MSACPLLVFPASVACEQGVLLQVIDLGDSMDFTVLPGSQQDSLTCNMEGVPTDDSNLVIKVGKPLSVTSPSALLGLLHRYPSRGLFLGSCQSYTQSTLLLYEAALDKILHASMSLLPKASGARRSWQSMHYKLMPLACLCTPSAS